MRYRGLAQSCGTVPPISQRPLRRSTTYQGQERSRCSSRDQITGWLGAPRAVAQAFLFANEPGFPPTRWRRVFPQPVAQSFLSPIGRGFPQAKRFKFSLSPGGSELSSHYATRGFPSAAQLEVFPFADGPELSSPHTTRGFPSATHLEVLPAPVAQSFLLRTRLGVSPPPHTLKFSLCRWLEVPPCGFPSCRWHRAFPETRGLRVCPIPGWPGVSPAPVAPDFSLPESRELSFAGWLGVSPSPVTVPGGREISTPISGTAQEVSGSNFKILWPSTSHPQLTLGCPPRRTFLHRVLHRTVHRRDPCDARDEGQPSDG